MNWCVQKRRAQGRDNEAIQPDYRSCFAQGPRPLSNTPELSGSHVAVIVQVENGHILTISHGGQGNPTYCWVGSAPPNDQRHFPADTREHKFYSWYPTQNELLATQYAEVTKAMKADGAAAAEIAAQNPVSKPARPIEATEPASITEQKVEAIDVPSVMGGGDK